MVSQVFSDFLERFKRRSIIAGQSLHSIFQTVIDVILNKYALGLANSLFHRTKPRL